MSDLTVSIDAALVLQGGGSRGAFTAGILDVLMEHGLYFPYVIGTSAGALNAVNYISQDIGRSRFVSTELMSDPKFISVRNIFFRGTAFNFTYLFHTIPKTKCPFNVGQYNNSPIEFYAATTSVETGEAVYFKKGECKDFYKALAASSSLPIISRPVNVENHPYLDGGVVDATPFRKPLEEGIAKIVVVQTRPKGYRKKKHAWWKPLCSKMLYRHCPAFQKAYRRSWEVYNQDMDEMERLQEEGRILIVRPDEPPAVGLIERNKDRLYALYDKGREVMEANLPRLYAYLGIAHE